MGSPPTLDPGPNRPPDLTCQAVASETSYWSTCGPRLPSAGMRFGDWPLDQIASGFGGDLDARHRHDHNRLATEFTHTHPDLARDPIRDGERTFDRLNPDYGVPADQRSRFGRQAVRDRRPPWRSGAGGRPRQPPKRPQPPSAGRPGLPHGRGPPRRPRPAHRARHGPERTGSER